MKRSLQIKIVVLSIITLLNTSFIFSSQTPLQMVRKSNQDILNIFIFNKNIDKEHESRISRIIHKFVTDQLYDKDELRKVLAGIQEMKAM